MDYDEQCAHAAHAQGLTPVLERLTRERVTHRLDQTGGWTMVVAVPCPDGREVTVINDGPWLVTEYDYASEPDDEGFELLTSDDFEAAIRAIIERVRTGWFRTSDREYRGKRFIIKQGSRSGLWSVYRLDWAKRFLIGGHTSAEAACDWADAQR